MINFIDNSSYFDDKKVNFIYGLAGNPMHIGHIEVIKELLNVKGAKIHVVLSKRHAFGKKLLDYNTRKYILNVLIDENFNKAERERIITNDVELLIEKEDPIFSFDLMEYYKKEYKECNFVWVFGEDNCTEDMIVKFKNYQEIIKWEILKIKETLFLRSTDIRNYVKNNNLNLLRKIYNNEIVNLLMRKKEENDYWL